jgi:hypothetical protein
MVIIMMRMMMTTTTTMMKKMMTTLKSHHNVAAIVGQNRRMALVSVTPLVKQRPIAVLITSNLALLCGRRWWRRRKIISQRA